MNSPTSTGKRISLWLGIMLCVTILALSACGRSREESVETPTVEPTFTVAEPTATEAPPTPTEEPVVSEAPAAEEVAVDATEAMTDTEAAAVDATDAVTDTEEAAVDATETVTDTETAAEEPAAEDAGGVAAVTAAITKGTCNACHMIPGIEGANIGVIGPNLANIGVAAATRVEGQTAEEYIQNSIRNPNDFIAPECPTGDCLPNLMLQNLTELLTDDEINLIVSYLLTLDGSQ